MVVFDMDSTLIQQEVIDEIARHAGVVDQVSVKLRLFFFIHLNTIAIIKPTNQITNF